MNADVRALNRAKRDAQRRVRRSADRDESEDWSAVWHYLDDEREALRPAWQRRLRGSTTEPTP